MKKLAVLILLFLAFGIVLYVQDRRIKELVRERDRYKSNTETLMGDVEKFTIRDSLNAARVGELELSLKEFERFRAEDAAIIKQLKSKNRDLEAVSKAQSEMIVELSTMAKDTVVLHDSIPVPALALHAGDEWYDFDGILEGRKFTGTMVARDSLIIAESVQYKRFLFWKTKRVKNREISATSKNPHVTIEGLEFISITK